MILLLQGFLSAQFNENIPTGHWIYRSIAKLQVQGYFRQLEQGCQPYTRRQLACALWQEINSKKLEFISKNSEFSIIEHSKLNINNSSLIELNRIAEELHKELTYLQHVSSDSAGYNSYIKIGATGLGRFRQSTESENKSHLRAKGFLSVGNHISVKYSAIVQHQPTDDTLYIGDQWQNWGGFQEQVYVAYNNSFLELKYGRDYVKWGYGKDGRLLVSDASRPYDLVSIKARADWIFVQAFVAQLDNMYQARRYLTAARITLNPLDNLYLSAAQAGLYGGVNQNVDFTLSNPFSVSYFAQHNDPKNLNAMIYLDAAYYLQNRFKFYGELLVDDFQVDNESKGDLEPNEIAFLVGVEGGGLPYDLHSWLEFTQVRNRTYNTGTNYEKFVHRNYPIGHWLGTDFRRLQGQLDRWLSPHFRLEAGYDLIRQGEGTILGEFTTPWTAPDVTMETGYQEKIPYGIVETTQRLQLGLHYEPNVHLQTDLHLGYEHIRNVDHQKGQQEGGMFVDFSLWLDYDYLFIKKDF